MEIHMQRGNKFIKLILITLVSTEKNKCGSVYFGDNFDNRFRLRKNHLDNAMELPPKNFNRLIAPLYLSVN